MQRGRSKKNKLSNSTKPHRFSLPQIFKTIFGKKTILFVTNEKIKTINIGSATQVTLALFLLWVGNLFWQSLQYNAILNAKSQEITRLESVNSFFGNEIDHMNVKLKKIRQYLSFLTHENTKQDLEPKSIKKPKNFQEEALLSDEKIIFNNYKKADNQIANIQFVVQKRIKKIESLIAFTGLNIKKLENNNTINASLNHKKFSLKPIKYSMIGQGGPILDDKAMEFAISELNFDYDLTKNLEKSHFTSEVSYLMDLEKLMNIMPFGQPMKNYHISSNFGVRFDPITGRKAMHRGLDFVGQDQEQIISPADGKIILAGRYNEYGNAIVIDHGFGITTRYGHLSQINVKKGQIIKTGDVIALQGNSGRSTGPHLHYEVRYKNIALDPQHFLRAGQFLSQKKLQNSENSYAKYAKL